MAKRYKPPRDTTDKPSPMLHSHKHMNRIRASRQYSIKTYTLISISPTAKTRRTKFQSLFTSQVLNYAGNTVITTAAPPGANSTFSELRIRIPAFQNMHKLLRGAAAQTNNAIFSHNSSSSAHNSRRVLKLLKLLNHLQSCTQLHLTPLSSRDRKTIPTVERRKPKPFVIMTEPLFN